MEAVKTNRLIPRLRSFSSSMGTVLGVYVVLVGMLVLCAIFVPGFASVPNLINLLQHSVVLGLISVGQSFVIFGGSIDLSVGSAISALAVFSSLVMQGQASNIPKAVLFALAAGALIGLGNGLIITRLKVHPFITTLGTSLIIRGALFAKFNSQAGLVPKEFEALGYDRIGLIPLGVILLLFVLLAAFFLTRYTRFGQHLYATGGNAEIARLSGVRTGSVLVLAHILTGLIAGITALFMVSRLRAADPLLGQGLDLDSIAATVIGGAPLSGGVGSIWGTIAGVLILSILNNIFNLLNVGAFAQNVLRGVIVILVVAFYTFRSQKRPI
jgi:ribose/xylose/arabinose/galactoside ABC-type transport system permease subunit